MAYLKVEGKEPEERLIMQWREGIPSGEMVVSPARILA